MEECIKIQHEHEYSYNDLNNKTNLCVCGANLPQWGKDSDYCKITQCEKCNRVFTATSIVFFIEEID